MLDIERDAVCEVTLDPTNMYWDEPDMDSLDTILESDLVNNPPKEGEIWKCDFTFNDTSHGMKDRWAVILKNGSGKLVVVQAGTAKNKKRKVVEYKTNYIFKDWKKDDPDDPRLFLSGSVHRFPNMIRMKKCVGTLSKRDLEGCKAALAVYERDKFSDPWVYINWMKNEYVSITTHSSGNNNNCKLQSFTDIAKSKKANCVDICTAVRHICNIQPRKLQHKIIWSRFIKENGTSIGHVFIIFKAGKNWYSFRYMPEQHVGEIKGLYDMTENESIDIEVAFLKTDIDRKVAKETTTERRIILDDEDLKLWDRYVKNKKTQRELLDKIDERHSVGTVDAPISTKEGLSFDDIYQNLI